MGSLKITTMRIYFGVVAAVHIGLGGVEAWGWQGHDMVARIATSLLNDAAAAKVKSILENDDCGPYAPCEYGTDLPGCSGWADTIKSEPEWKWTAPVHFINTPDSKDLSACSYNYDRDCIADSVKGRCSAGGINNYSQQLYQSHVAERTSLMEANLAPAATLIQHVGKKHNRLEPHSALITVVNESSFTSCAGAKHNYHCGSGCTYVHAKNAAICGVKEYGCYDCSKLKSGCPDCGGGPTPTPSGKNDACALKFLDHFIGDIHQPLHVGFTSDKGGNTEYCQWYGESTLDHFPVELHGVWDFNIIQKFMKVNNKTTTQWAADLAKRVTPAQLKEWGSCSDSKALACPDEWATESVETACAVAYRDADNKSIAFSTGFNLADEYYNKALPVVELRIAQGGVRLASVLNRIWG